MAKPPPNPRSEAERARPVRALRHDAEDHAPPDAAIWPPLAPGEALDLTSDAHVYRCPACARWVARLPTGVLRYHGATAERGRRCGYPEDDTRGEGTHIRTHEGLDILAERWPRFAAVYAAVRKRLDATRKRAHGGPLRNPDPRDPDWRWRR